MSWYAYCIAERQSFPELCRHRRPMPLTGVTGLFGNQAFLFPASDLAIVVTEHNEEDGARMDQQAAKDHARVISECFKLSTVLPFRFGTTFQDDDALRRSVRSNQRHFQANVERLRGKAEMHLKVLVDDTCPGGPAVPDQSAGERKPAARAAVEGAGCFGADASDVSTDCGRDYLQADGLGEDAAGYRSLDRQQDDRAIPEQILLSNSGVEGMPDAALGAVASISLCTAFQLSAA
jgi:Gas vesicle synthesis protein GvpL/GvpF